MERPKISDAEQLQLVELEPEKATRLERLREIVKEHQAMMVDGQLVDATTANMLVQVCDALNAKNRSKFLGFTVDKMAHVGWKLVN